jgi:hypothetical protein
MDVPIRSSVWLFTTRQKPINDKKERLKRFFFNAFLAKSVKCNTFAPCYGK